MQADILESLKWRYATKKFDETRKLSEDQVELLKEAFNLTATSYGLQPLKMLVISDQEIKESLVSASMDQQQIWQASHILVFCIEDSISSKYIKDHFSRVEDIRNTSREILDDYENYLIDSFSEKSKEDIQAWMTKQAYLAMGNLLTVCAMAQIDACPMEGFEPKKYDEILKLQEKGLNSVLVMPVGYRAEDDPASEFKKVRRGVEEVVLEIQ